MWQDLCHLAAAQVSACEGPVWVGGELQPCVTEDALETGSERLGDLIQATLLAGLGAAVHIQISDPKPHAPFAVRPALDCYRVPSTLRSCPSVVLERLACNSFPSPMEPGTDGPEPVAKHSGPPGISCSPVKSS